MPSIVAALIALIAGACIAAYLYYKRGAKFPWDLALLRFLWFGLLVYAIVAPPYETEVEDKVKPHLTVLVDTSASLGLNGDSLMDHASEPFVSLGYHVDLNDFAEKHIPSQSNWAYVGDGHIPSISGKNTPLYYSLHPSQKLEPSSLIQGIVVPPKVLAGSLVNIRALVNPECEVTLSFNGDNHRGRLWTTNAPLDTGYMPLQVIASLDGRKDVLETSIQVSGSLATILIVRNEPHPHEGMIRRICRKKGIAVKTVNWSELNRIKTFSGPIITLGGSKDALVRLEKVSKVPALHLDITGANTYANNNLLTHSLFDYSVQVYHGKGIPTIKISDKSIDARGIHWYKSALEDPRSLSAFEQLIKLVLERYEPVQLMLTLPQQAQTGERIHVSAAAVNSRSEAIPATITGYVRLQDKVTENLTDRSEGLSMNSSFIPHVPGSYMVVVEGKTEFGTIENMATVQVNDVDIESVRTFNTVQFNFWKSEGSQLLSMVEEKVLPESIIYKKEIPQHLHWWYWGIVLFAATSEWTIRRSRGLV
ncbi:MAG: hypothetical protein CMP53_01130 [Flavobacteriales bacterium]|nr:hypothetical protein [Flavobacteriales bacterium]